MRTVSVRLSVALKPRLFPLKADDDHRSHLGVASIRIRDLTGGNGAVTSREEWRGRPVTAPETAHIWMSATYRRG